ncbi:helix-turn-helix domain-containing protein [Lentzea sp. NPDC058436]|uniref:helix-turn-helix domain-containing protein n=1 Tax=Lentzea sp. NPDC058436 TaxID=3346499 RepID=UPI00364D8A91
MSTLRMLRQERGWSLDTLAERSGASKSYLSKVERGQSTPSIAVAISLATALGVDVAEIFGEAASTAHIELTRRDDYSRASATPGDGSPYVGLATRISGKHMLPFVIHPPTERERCVFKEHAGDEFVVVQSGRVELSFPDRVEQLDAGDTAYFRGGIPHHFRSLDGQRAQVLVVIAAPG